MFHDLYDSNLTLPFSNFKPHNLPDFFLVLQVCFLKKNQQQKNLKKRKFSISSHQNLPNCAFPLPCSPCHILLSFSSWAEGSQRWRKKRACPPRWPLWWVSLHRAHYRCPPWPSGADTAQGCCPPHTARWHSTSECGGEPRDHRDLLSEAGWQGRKDQSKVSEADYGEENTWERRWERLVGREKCEESLIREMRGCRSNSWTLMCDSVPFHM